MDVRSWMSIFPHYYCYYVLTIVITINNSAIIIMGDPFWPVKNWPVIFRPVKFGQLFYAN